nr:MAG: putative replicase polyprotein [Cripavirus sp.]
MTQNKQASEQIMDNNNAAQVDNIVDDFMYIDIAVELRIGEEHFTEFTKEWFDYYDYCVAKHNFAGYDTGKHIRFNPLCLTASWCWYQHMEMYLRYGHTFDEIKALMPYSDYFGQSMRLLLSGDVETNPGPVQSRPQLYRNNDPRLTKLEKAIMRSQQKTNSLIKHLRREIKYGAIHAQLFGITDAWNKSNEKAENINQNLTRVVDFLETTLPAIQNNLDATICNFTDSNNKTRDDLIKLVLLLLILRLMMVWKSYKGALIIILLFIVKFYGFDKSIIDLVLELKNRLTRVEAQAGMEDVVYHPYFETCGKLIFAFMAFVCIKKIPGKQDWDSYMTRLDRIPKAVNGVSKIFDWCSEYFNVANDQIKMMILGKTREELRRANGLYDEIYQWAQDVRLYLDLDERNKIDTNVEIATRVQELYTRGLKYQADTLLASDREISRLITSTLIPARALHEYVSMSPVKGGGPRMRPVCLWLIGESGVGKTEMVYPFCIDMLRTMGLLNKKDFHHQVYGRQVETEYHDGYKSQKIVIYDDAFQMKDDKTKPNPEIFEVIRSCNTFPQHLHMAALHDKNTFSSAEVMIYTTNDMNVKLESITFPDAFYNRIGEFAFKVQPILEKSVVVDIASSGRTYRKLDKTKLDPGVAIDLSVYEFQRIVRDSSTHDDNSSIQWIEQGKPLNYEKFAELMCGEWRKKKDDSINKIKFLENYAIRPQMGEEFYDAENFDTEYFNNDLSERFCRGETLIDIENDYMENDNKYDAYLVYKQHLRPTKWDKFKDRMNSALMAARTYLEGLRLEIFKIVKKHPYLSLLGFVSIALSAFTMYQWFQNGLNENIEVEVGTSGDSKTLKMAKRIVEVGVSGDVKTNKQSGVRVEVGTSGDVKTNKQNVRRVEMMDSELSDVVKSQGCSDDVAHTLITDVLQKNTYRLSYKRNDVRHTLGNCTFVCGWSMIMPYHFFRALHARRLAPESIIYFSQSHFNDIIQVPLSHLLDCTGMEFRLSDNCVQLQHANGDMRDCVLTNLHGQMCHPHRDLRRHFVLKSDQGKLVGRFNGTMATFHENGGETYRTYQWLQQIRPIDKEITIYYPDDGFEYGSDSYTQRDCYEYNAPTQVGDCGSIIGLYNKRIERKLIGMHIAGTKQEYGFACPLTQEVIQGALDQLERNNIKNISAQVYFEPPLGVDTLVESDVPEGLFCPLGKSNKMVGQAVKTAILPSCISGLLSTPFMKPALLRPTKIDGVLHNPLMRGLKKCGVETAVLLEEDVLSAAQDVSQIVLNGYDTQLDVKKYQRILTYEEAIRGTGDDDFMCAINRTTSPGFPYSLENKGSPGKTRWMGSGCDFDFISSNALQLRSDVEELLENCRIGKITGVLFVDTLKDERREIEKVNIGKTRVFSAGPQHFVVAFRKYFLPFSAWLMHNRIDNEVAVGTNPYSLDWEKIAKRLKSKGKHVVAGDFGNFDGSLVAQILWSIFWEIFVVWLKQFNDFDTEDGMGVLKTCLGLWTHLVHSVHIYGDNVYMWTHSQPSGNPFTVIINCLYNAIIMRISWIRIMQRDCPQLSSMKCFRKNVSLITYGDDNCLNISDGVIKYFNQRKISEIMLEMKHEYTDEGKTGVIVESRSLDDIFFLKRKFLFNEELQRTVAPLKIEVIYEMLNWTRNTIDPNVILMNNIETAFREIVFHGRSEYEKLKSGITRIARDLPSIPQILTYNAYLRDVTYQADTLYQF